MDKRGCRYTKYIEYDSRLNAASLCSRWQRLLLDQFSNLILCVCVGLVQGMLQAFEIDNGPKINAASLI